MGTRPGCPLSPLLFNIVLENLARAIRQTKEIKGIRIGKEELKPSLFVDDMILYLEDPKTSSRKLLDLINEFSKIAGYKINTHKSKAFLYASNKTSEMEMRKTTPFAITSGKKILGNQSNKRSKGSLQEKLENIEERSEEHLRGWKALP